MNRNHQSIFVCLFNFQDCLNFTPHFVFYGDGHGINYFTGDVC